MTRKEEKGYNQMKRIWKVMIVMILCGTQMIGCASESSNQVDNIAGENPTTTVDNNTTSGDSMLQGIYTGELEQNVTIRVLENDTAIEQGYFQELIDAFNTSYQSQGIIAVDANMDQYSNLADDGPYGYGPDVIYQANDSLMKYVEGKHIYPIPVESLEGYTQIPDTAWEAYQSEIDGVTYTMGVPVNVQSSMLFYRKDMLPDQWEINWDDNKNNIPDMVETWGDLYQYSKEIVAQGNGKYGYMKSLYDVYFSSGYLFSYGGYIFGDNNTNPSEIGLAGGNAEVGAEILLQLASLMNEECIDDSITTSSYKNIANGTYFATMTTPDVYTLFIKELALEYENQGMSKEDAKALAMENLVVTELPTLPASGNLEDGDGEQIPLKAMGGVNGYAISAYTKAPNACLAFMEFATSYEMVAKRNDMLGIVPARSDVASAIGGTSELMFKNLDAGNIVVMPSNRAMAQVWTPAETFFQDLAKDAFRVSDKKFTSPEIIKKHLEVVCDQIHDAIFILSE